MKRTAMVLAALLLALLLPGAAQALEPLTEIRFCGPPARNSDGSIRRRADVLYAFRKAHPCPSTGRTTGACPGWSMDHVVPLASCGCDAVWNLQWLPNGIKSAAGGLAKDRWERRGYTCPLKKHRRTP
jgi:hypothetical protein